MALLVLFAFVAGAGTSLSPCVLPVLPVALSAGASGGRRRPLGVATGMTLSFTFAVVGAVYLIDALGLPNGFLRTLAIVVLLGFGLALLLPAVGRRIEGWLSARLARSSGARRDSDGFRSGAVLGLGLGLVYFPCAGPVLAGVITASAAQDFTAGRLAVASAYALGAAVVLYALMLGGRRLTAGLVARSARFQQALGAVMVVVALAMVVDLDTRFQTAIADELPSFLVNPTGEIEDAEAVRSRLAELRGGGGGIGERAEEGSEDAPVSDLPVYGDAPELERTGHWFNTPGGRGLELSDQRGKVVLIDFWTYTCINCIRTFPYLREWDRRYRDDGLVVIGVHTPEFPFERETGNVADAIEQNGIRYPVVQDNDYGTWDAFGNRYWPAKYLIDARGRIRFAHFGEGEYERTEEAIRALLAEAGADRLGGRARPGAEAPAAGVETRETYLGTARAEGFAGDPPIAGRFTYRAPGSLPRNAFAFQGAWTLSDESARAGANARLHARFVARRVFLVLGSPERERRMRVLLDGRPLPDRLAGSDVSGGVVRVSGQRLYRLVDLPRVGDHTLTLVPEAGVEGYAFTFG